MFGGPLGFASASANVLLEQASGNDLLGHAVAMFSGDETSPAEKMTADPELVAQTPGDTPGDTPGEAGSVLVAAADTAPPETIVWAGPRVIPSLARDVNSSLIQEVAQNSHTNTKDEKSTTDAAETRPEPQPPRSCLRAKMAR